MIVVIAGTYRTASTFMFSKVIAYLDDHASEDFYSDTLIQTNHVYKTHGYYPSLANAADHIILTWRPGVKIIKSMQALKDKGETSGAAQPDQFPTYMDCVMEWVKHKPHVFYERNIGHVDEWMKARLF